MQLNKTNPVFLYAQNFVLVKGFCRNVNISRHYVTLVRSRIGKYLDLFQNSCHHIHINIHFDEISYKAFLDLMDILQFFHCYHQRFDFYNRFAFIVVYDYVFSRLNFASVIWDMKYKMYKEGYKRIQNKLLTYLSSRGNFWRLMQNGIFWISFFFRTSLSS